MKLDTKALRYLTTEDWRVLTAVEQGSRNHEVVPTPLIITLSGLRGGSGVHRSISTLAKANLIARVKNAKSINTPAPLTTDDGYRLTYGGLDHLALHTHLKHSTLFSLGNQIGVGKESDIYVAASPAGITHVLKLHRLGRISFRTVKANRDYLRHRASGSWMYMSRLAALKEFTFMKALRENGFAVPDPVAHSRHTIVMSLVDAFPLRQIRDVPDPAALYAELMEMILRLAKWGLIHGDFNEFNILIKEEATKEQVPAADGKEDSLHSAGEDSTTPGSLTKLNPVLIDFPQMVSMSHADAAMYFNRDVNCIKNFFQRRFHFTSSAPGPFFEDAKKTVGRDGVKRLDVEAEASGFSKKMSKELEAYMREVGVDGDGGRNVDVEDDSAAEDSEGSGRSEDSGNDEQTTLGSSESPHLKQKSEDAGLSTKVAVSSIDDGTSVLSINDNT
ncbi:hypothetical protein MMC26_002581 [Xylographa opegraphella]|nr:hypothetical protein [Xylographa opegraphella]